MNQINVNAYFKTLQIFYFAQIAGQLIFSAIAFIINTTEPMQVFEPELVSMLVYLIPAIVMASFAASFFVFKMLLKKAIEKETLPQKLAAYRSALIVRFAMLEMPSFIATLMFLFTGKYLFLGLAALVILYFFALKPSKERAANDLEAQWE